MAALDEGAVVAVIGAGTMGSGIAQVVATAGHKVRLFDAADGAVDKALAAVAQSLDRLVSKSRISAEDKDRCLDNLVPAKNLDDLADAALVIEAVVEDAEAKRDLFARLESRLKDSAILASNTSSISITGLAQGLERPERVVGMHFFNPPPLMALVEIVSGLGTDPGVAETAFETAKAWGKAPVHAKSTPAFIVNRVARPFYGEAFRILDEGYADIATIDAVMREMGGFRMGPFQLIDLVGVDVNLAVTKSVHAAFYGDPRYQPSVTQQAYVDAGWLGRKAGRGFYSYGEESAAKKPAEADPAPRPEAVLIEGDLGPAAALVELIGEAGIPARREREGAYGPAIICDDAVLQLTDGRMATERRHDQDVDLVLFDLALDYARCGRIALAPADGIALSSLNAAVGLFQAIGKQVSVIDDSPGMIAMRTICMLANEGADAVQKGVANPAGVDDAMLKGVNYPLGPLAWADRLGAATVVTVLDNMARTYGEDRYRAVPGLRRMAYSGSRFHD